MPITQEQKQRIINLYNTGQLIISIEKSEKVSRPTIRKILRSAGVREVYKKDIDKSDTINSNYFDNIDIEEKAYFLGLLYADGNIYYGSKNRKHYSLSINLVEEDKYILERFRDVIAPEHKLYIVDKSKQNKNWQLQYKFLIDNKQITEDLAKFGCTSKKSLTLTFPQNISKHLYQHFIRGYFDGDGCISSYLSKESNRTYLKYSASFASTKNFCKYLGAFLEEHLNLNYSLYTRKSNNITSELTISGNHQVYKFMSWLYKDATIFLKRKHDKFLELSTQLNKNAETN